jgi:hypothetical protein
MIGDSEVQSRATAGPCPLAGFTTSFSLPFPTPLQFTAVGLDGGLANMPSPLQPTALSSLSTMANYSARTSNTSALDPLTEDIVCLLNDEGYLLYYRALTQSLTLQHLPPSAEVNAPVFLDGLLYVAKISEMGPGQFTFSTGRYIYGGVVQMMAPVFSLSANGYFSTDQISSATNGIDELYFLSGTHLLVVANPGPSQTFSYLELAAPFTAFYYGLEYKASGILMAIRQTSTAIELIEIDLNTQIQTPVFDIAGSVSPSSGGWILSPDYYSTALDTCAQVYYISTLADFVPTSSSNLVAIDLISGTHSSHPMNEFFFGIEVLSNKCCKPAPCTDTWAGRAGGPSRDVGRAITTDAAGYIYTTGNVQQVVDFAPIPPIPTPNGDIDAYVARQAPDGAYLWVKFFAGANYDEGRSIAVGPSGNIYVTGMLGDHVNGTTGFLVKLDPDGNTIWMKTFLGAVGYGLALDGDENLYVTGDFSGTVVFGQDALGNVMNLTAAGTDAFIIKYDHDGIVQNSKQFGSQTGGARGNAIAVGSSGEVVLIGDFAGNLVFGPPLVNLTSNGGKDIFLVKMDASLSTIWWDHMGGEEDDHGAAVVIDHDGEVYITGGIRGYFIYGFCPYPPLQSTLDGITEDIVVSRRRGTDGSCLWTTQFRGLVTNPNNNRGHSLFLNPTEDQLYITGTFHESVDFQAGVPWPNQVLSSSGKSDIFLASLHSATGSSYAPAIAFGGPENDSGHGITIGMDGCVLSIGNFIATVNFQADINLPAISLTHVGIDSDIYVHKMCPCCCEDSTVFQTILAQGFDNIVIDNLDCEVEISLSLPECYRLLSETPDWGDGTPPTGGITQPASGTWTHTYNQPGTYTICIEVAEYRNNAECWRDTLCSTVLMDLDNSAFVIQDSMICKSLPSIDIPLSSSTTCTNTGANWYIRPCGSGSPFTLVHSSSGLDPLPFYPAQMSGNCYEIYAEVLFDGMACCGRVSYITDTARLELLPPASGVIVHSTVHCESALSQTLTLNLTNASSVQAIQWLYNGQPIPNANGLTHVTGMLDYQGPPNACSANHWFLVQITDLCPPNPSLTDPAYVQIINPNRPIGTLTLSPQQALPLCHGNDARLEYIQGCASSWTWYSTTVASPQPSDYSPIPGMINTTIRYLNTNQIRENTWYQVRGNILPCPQDTAELYVPVKDTLVITDFKVTPSPCVDNIILELEFTPSVFPGPSPCSYEVEWYANGQLLGTSQSSSSPISFSPFTTGHSSLAGNYTAVIRDNCCDGRWASDTLSIGPSCDPVISAPCYRCPGVLSPIVLEGSMVLPPGLPCPDLCTYQWYDEYGLPIQNANALTLVSATGGHFTLESNCNGCIKSTSTFVKDCDGFVSTEGPEKNCFDIRWIPNPSSGLITMHIAPQPLIQGRLLVIDALGRLAFEQTIPEDLPAFSFNLAHLPSGTYFAQVYQKGVLAGTGRIILEK